MVDPAIADAVDELGSLKGQLEKLQGRERELREVILGAGAPEITGRTYRARVSVATRWSLNLLEAKKQLGADWCAEHSSLSTARSIKVTPRVDVIEAAAAARPAA